jgi:GrpB-like predicted nucleotidyltransferase (UPF0157 family)
MSEVRIIEYQDTWALQYEHVEAELRSVLPIAGFALEHIGSTAVPGLSAKPVLDIVLGVNAFQDVERSIAALAQVGFIYRPKYEAQIPDRRYFVRPAGQTLRVHLHSVILGQQLWQQHVRFREALRQDQRTMLAYAELKRRLAVLHASDKAAYTEAKAPFIMQVLEKQGPTSGRSALSQLVR